MNTFSCIITAGGAGVRFNKDQKKQFIKLNGVPLLNIAISIFYDIQQINEIIITLPETEYEEQSALLHKSYPSKIECVLGGTTRQKSIYNALQICDTNNPYVLIHDAARPFFNRDDLIAMLDTITSSLYSGNPCVGLVPGRKMTNTIKTVQPFQTPDVETGSMKIGTDKASHYQVIQKTLERDNLIEVFTPQIFKLALIKDYHERVQHLNINFTDDASIFEYFKESVRLFETSSGSLKITTPADLLYAEYILLRQNNV